AFADFEDALDELGWDYIDGALVDLGVSSLQLDKPERGFSFLHDGPLDMRMNPNGGHEPAAALVNRATVQRLKEIIEIYGEEPQAGRIARAIDDARSAKPIETTLELASIVENAYPPKWRATARNHPATRTFQALRLVVNEELAQLEAFLERIVPRLAPGGRVAVISFHSLEDRIVKHFFRTASTGCLCPPSILHCRCGHEASLRLVTKKALEATPEEVKVNSRSRSAKLRVAERTDKPFSLPPSMDSGADGAHGGRRGSGNSGRGNSRQGGGKRGGRR
ncbi:16S rRNA (cytosine(1402)-N(4))-methyltransferase RsmH, partial [Desulfovibrio sp. OttesenSCG-928-C06]|nr:16S rRNA (cytosine(1402)-N(4))-methyltransferase RsmH [Desulfovibrio sp. OttesenSCG-928-C06]